MRLIATVAAVALWIMTWYAIGAIIYWRLKQYA